MQRRFLALGILLTLASCETPTAYQPAPGPLAVGYSEARIEPGRYRVTFRGGPGAPGAEVDDYALLRAAELALRDGYDWFRVTGRSGEARSGGAGALSIGGGSAEFGHGGGVGFGVGTTIPLGGGPALTRTLEIQMGRGPTPDEPDVYDARGVRTAIGERLSAAPSAPTR
jgi:hypothetical protein